MRSCGPQRPDRLQLERPRRGRRPRVHTNIDVRHRRLGSRRASLFERFVPQHLEHQHARSSSGEQKLGSPTNICLKALVNCTNPKALVRPVRQNRGNDGRENPLHPKKSLPEPCFHYRLCRWNEIVGPLHLVPAGSRTLTSTTPLNVTEPRQAWRGQTCSPNTDTDLARGTRSAFEKARRASEQPPWVDSRRLALSAQTGVADIRS